MTIQDNWKRELDRLHLTEIQKQRMADRVMSGEKEKKKKSYVVVIFPAFIALATFLAWLTVQPDGTVQQTTAAMETAQSSMTMEKIIWLTLTLILMMSAYTLALISLLKVKRWQSSEKVQRVIENLRSSRLIWVVIGLLGFGFGITLMAVNLESIVLLQFFFIIFLFLNTSFSQILLTRNAERARCPHCGTELTNKEMLKKSFMIYDARCSACDKKMYYDRKINNRAYLIHMLGFPFCMLMPNVGIPLYLIGVYFLFYSTFTFGYLYPYTVRFSLQSEEQQPPLW